MRCPALSWNRSLAAILCAGWVICRPALASDSQEFWPELSAYFQLGPRSRVVLDTAFTDGKESEVATGEVAAFLDVSLKPIARKELQSEDWQRSRFFWLRLGYDRIFKIQSGEREVSEDRGIVALHGKVPLPARIWLEARARWDLRWIGGDSSDRYRLRLEASREFPLRRRTVVPFLNVEWFYDTRYDGWSRTLVQAAAEVTLNEHFRYELGLAHQADHLPEASSLDALVFVVKYYR
jgi:hypothetical protein